MWKEVVMAYARYCSIILASYLIGAVVGNIHLEDQQGDERIT
jgi:hypothetical protein